MINKIDGERDRYWNRTMEYKAPGQKLTDRNRRSICSMGGSTTTRKIAFLIDYSFFKLADYKIAIVRSVSMRSSIHRNSQIVMTKK